MRGVGLRPVKPPTSRRHAPALAGAAAAVVAAAPLGVEVADGAAGAVVADDAIAEAADGVR